MSIVLDPPAEFDSVSRDAGHPAITQAAWHPVCRLDDLEPEWGEAALVDGEQVAVYRLWDDSVRAVSNRDPATGSYVMARGIVGSRDGRATVASPLHKQVYDLQTGECLSHSGLAVPVFDTRITAGTVEINMDTAA